MNEATPSILTAPMHDWRPLYWEPVDGTGERLMVGVLHAYAGTVGTARLIRDDVLDALFGHQAVGARQLIDKSLEMYQAVASVGSVAEAGVGLLALQPGPVRRTAARSLSELLHTAALLYSSLANLDKLDELEEADAPQQEEVSRRFSTEVRELVSAERPDLSSGFGRGGLLVPGGQSVRFGFFDARAVIHFTVISPVRQGQGVRDARARLFELQRACSVAQVTRAALIAAVPREDDPTLGPKQRDALKRNRSEIEREADAVGMRWHSVTSAAEGAQRLIETVG